MEYAIAAIIVVVLGFAAWLGVRAYDAGKTKQAAEEWREAAKKRRKGETILAEPVAEERGWLASARRRLHRKMQDDADD